MTVRNLRAIRTGAVAATLAGVASAVVTRALMRAVAVLVREPTTFSLGGSAGIALIYTVALLPGCIALALSPRRWPWLLLGGGAALLIFEAAAIGTEEVSGAGDLGSVRIVAIGAVLLAMTVTYGWQIRAAARFSRRGQTPAEPCTPRTGTPNRVCVGLVVREPR
jgi:hypothetical protein